MKALLISTAFLALAACNDGMTYNSDTQDQANRHMQHGEEYNSDLSQSHGYNTTNVHQSDNGFPVRRPYGCSPGQASKNMC